MSGERMQKNNWRAFAEDVIENLGIIANNTFHSGILNGGTKGRRKRSASEHARRATGARFKTDNFEGALLGSRLAPGSLRISYMLAR